MHDGALTIHLSSVDGSTCLTMTGEIDANSVVTMRAALDQLDLDTYVVLDMSAVRFMDSSGVNALVNHCQRIEGAGGSLHITDPSRAVRRVLEVSGLGYMFDDLQNQ